MASFDAAFDILMELEGGWCNVPGDRGGETKYGITKRSYPDLDIASLTIEQAKEIYRRDFWDEMRLSEVNDQDVANKLFDQAVNMGVGRAVRNVQKALNWVCATTRLDEDGVMGYLTLNAINNRPGDWMVNLTKAFQAHHYVELCRVAPEQRKFMQGWANRTQK